MPPKKAEAVFAWESIGQALDDGLEDLIATHGEEVEPEPMDLDWPAYLMMERQGVYRSVSARRGGKLVGYDSYFVRPPLHHKSVVWAVNDALYLDPAERRGLTAARLVRESERLLKEIGVKVLVREDRLTPNSPTGKAGARLGDLFVRLGYGLIGRLYMKTL